MSSFCVGSDTISDLCSASLALKIVQGFPVETKDCALSATQQDRMLSKGPLCVTPQLTFSSIKLLDKVEVKRIHPHRAS